MNRFGALLSAMVTVFPSVDSTSLCFRIRISTWARKAARNNELIDRARWDAIQRAFPQRVAARMEPGNENISSGEGLYVVIYFP